MMKQMKDMRDMVDAAPGMIAQAPQLGAQVQQLAAARLATVDPSNSRPTGWISGSLRQSVTVPPERPRKANELSVRTNESRVASPPLNTFTDGPNSLQ